MARRYFTKRKGFLQKKVNNNLGESLPTWHMNIGASFNRGCFFMSRRGKTTIFGLTVIFQKKIE